MNLNIVKKSTSLIIFLLTLTLPLVSQSFEILEEGSKEVYQTLESGEKSLIGTLDYVVLDVKGANIYVCDDYLVEDITCEWERYYFESGAYPTIKSYLSDDYFPLFISNEFIEEYQWWKEDIKDEDLTRGILVLYKGLNTRAQREIAASEIAFFYLDQLK